MSESTEQGPGPRVPAEGDLRVGRSGGVSATLFSVIGFCAGLTLGQEFWSGLSGGGLGFLFANWRTARDENENLRLALHRLEARHAVLDRRVRSGSSPAEETQAPANDPRVGVETMPRAFEAEGEGEGEGEGASVAQARALPEDDPEARTADADDRVASDPELDPAGESRSYDDGPPQSAPGEEERAGLEDAVAAAFARRRVEAAASAASTRGGGASASSLPPISDRSSSAGLGEVIYGFLFGGNAVVRVGLLVLLVGITLLAKYAVDHSLFPVEARLALAALMGLGLVGLGFRQRQQRPGFGLSLQGGGVAALFLTTFFAYRVYDLVPAGLAFTIFVALAAGTAALAVLQQSQALLVIGVLGGFAAPILASTGSNNYVALFSYYLLLNASIAAVALKQDWRIPARIAFAGTYGVGAVWGVSSYEPEFFSTTEPFLLAFGVLFTFIATALAFKRRDSPRGVVEGTLVFGTPFVSILMQAALVRDMEFGLALSAGGFGVFYALCATCVWRTTDRALRPLAECYVALAVGFATMAIPFAFDEALTTSVAWALEGAGLYWVGARQNRFLSRLAGVLLQALAATAFFVSASVNSIDPSDFLPIANGRAISCLALAFAGALIARQAAVSEETLSDAERKSTQLLGPWALLWWTGGVVAEVGQFVDPQNRPAVMLVVLALSAVALEWGSARSRWEFGRLLSLLSLPAAFFMIPVAYEFVPHLMAHGGFLAWPLLLAALYLLWERMDSADPSWVGAFRTGAIWLVAIVVSLSSFGLVDAVGLATDWQLAAFAVGLGGTLLVGLTQYARTASPFDRDADSAFVYGLLPLAAFSGLTILWMQLHARGNAAPLPHFPILNPVDLSVWFLGLVAVLTWRRVPGRVEASPPRASIGSGVAILGLTGLAFVCLNGVLIRAVHQWAGVPFDFDDLWRSNEMQMTFSIAWTSVGLAGMLWSSRLRMRPLWMGCAALLGLVVVKLFTVDLSQLSTVARIFTFLVVGVLLLVLGYLSPVPPSNDPDPEPVSEDSGLEGA